MGLTVPTDSIDLLQGTLDLLILKTLSWGPTHGYGVARWIQQITGDVLHVEEGSLYPALHRLEKREWIDSEWGLSENNRRARFYRLTRARHKSWKPKNAIGSRHRRSSCASLTCRRRICHEVIDASSQLHDEAPGRRRA